MKNLSLILIAGFAIGSAIGTVATIGFNLDAMRYVIIAFVAILGRFA